MFQTADAAAARQQPGGGADAGLVGPGAPGTADDGPQPAALAAAGRLERPAQTSGAAFLLAFDVYWILHSSSIEPLWWWFHGFDWILQQNGTWVFNI